MREIIMILARFNKCEVPNFFKRLDMQTEDFDNTHCFLRLIVALIKEFVWNRNI